ncbi:MAG TPA: NADP-dependent malic enzyme [Alphaproteobacteria bacterium]|nr:NADP-dependent malic enzyme [Alphaproteobacteria bacterium]
MTDDRLREAALEYHRQPPAGKLAILPTKPLNNQRDLSLAYSPGVAAACEAIVADPATAALYTGRGNLVAVISNGTAVLGLGAIGALAAKPVMEGKAVLFKKFAGIDVFDIEINERDPQKLIEVIAALEPTFGGINLEDIKAPECFEVESKLRARLKIPVFHDDQHGTAIIVGAAILNGLRVVGKTLGEVKLVVSGAGAAALACLDMLVSLGLKPENTWVTDIEGVVYKGRTALMDPRKERYARATDARTLGDVIAGADVFLGLSAPGVLTRAMVAKMAQQPLILALANPNPEITPEDAKAERPDAVIATGRSDYPNQVNNVLCFPFIFRGALDVGATTINEAMKIACVHALADLAQAEPSDIVVQAYGGQPPAFGPENLIPKPFDPRLIIELAPAVAKAAMDSGVATRPITDFKAYRQQLFEFVFKSGLSLKPVFDRAKQDPRRLVYCEGEDERVLRAVQTVVDEGLARPILIGRAEVVAKRVMALGLRIKPDRDFELVNPVADSRFSEYWRLYHQIMQRRGVTPEGARELVRTRPTVIGALMLQRGEAEAMLCGTNGGYSNHLSEVIDILDLEPGAHAAAALTMLVLNKGIYFITDTHVAYDPSAEDIAETAVMAAREVRRFGIEPKIALLSHTNFGSRKTESSRKMRDARRRIKKLAPDLEVEGEMQGDAAVSQAIRDRIFPNSELKGEANLLVMPTLDAANIAFNLLKQLGEGVSVGPMLLGVAKPAHILTSSVTVRGLVNMSALAVVDAQVHAAAQGSPR